MTIVMRPSCWHKHFGPNGLSAHAQGLCLNFFSLITADFNISSALWWAIQDQWSSGLVFFHQTWFSHAITLARPLRRSKTHLTGSGFSAPPLSPADVCIDQKTSGPVNAHLTPGLAIYFNAFVHVCSPRAGADNPLGTNVDVNRKLLSFCPFVASFKTVLQCFLWLSLSDDYRVTDEALLAETT